MAPVPKPAGQRRRRNRAPATVKLPPPRVAATTPEVSAARPTALMERASRYLEQQADPVSRRRVVDGVQGKATAIRVALVVLLAENHISEQPGPGRARLVASRVPYREATDASLAHESSCVPGVAPPLPGEEDATPAMRLWWREMWASSMATAWQPTDVYPLARLARLVDLESRGEATAAHLAAMTQLEDRFGLSPGARRRLQWEIEDAAPEAPSVADAAKGQDERWLKAVK